ncbi:hypothetical protein ABT297_18975 [Dactylosporangium sp. NPDC000555]|uniref:hypothetical protein n=1 Tax=Dactylosporangium sp. NPDC000555 TaxID=3154260 RepID=UPI003330CE76
MATAAAVGVGSFAGSTLVATPAWAADPLEIKVDGNVQAKVGEKVPIRFVVKNRSKEPVAGLTVTVQAPSTAIIDPADNPNCTVGGGGRTASCHSNATIAADKTVAGQIVLTAKTGGQGKGQIRVENGNADNFTLRTNGGPSPSMSPSPRRSAKSPSPSYSEAPPLSDETMGPPVAGNGVAIQPTSAPATSRASDSGGKSAGFWIGIVAIVGAALGLVGSLFYFRRKDSREPDTGMHPVVPAPAGFPSDGRGQPTTYGSPAAATQVVDPGGFGPPPSGPTQVINPGFGGQPSGPTQIINPNGPGQPPAGGDQTVIFHRPDQY